MQLDILLIAFNRPAHINSLLQTLKNLPNSSKFVFIDGARNHSDKLEQDIIKELLLKHKILKENIKYSESNIGINKAIPIAIDWFFSYGRNSQLLILEDDCIPSLVGIDSLKFLTENEMYIHKGIISLTNYFESITNSNTKPCMVSVKIPTIWGWSVNKDIWERININKTYQDLPSYAEVLFGTNLIFNSFSLIKLFITKFYHEKYGKYWGTWDNYLSLSMRREKILTYVLPFNAVSNIGYIGVNANINISKRNFNRSLGKFPKHSKALYYHSKNRTVVYSTFLSIIHFFPATLRLFYFLVKCLIYPKSIENKNYL
jgi:hypothetical protein